MLDRLGLRLRFAAFFAALGLGGTAVFWGALWLGWSRSGGAMDGFVVAGLIGGFGLIGLSAWISLLFDENVARPILSFANDLRARAATHIDAKIDQHPGRYLGHLAPAIDDIHTALAEARHDVQTTVNAHVAQVERETALLGALIRDLPQAIVVISAEARVLLFNPAAEAMLGPISLDRPMARYVLTPPLDRHVSSLNGARFLTQAERNGALLAGRITGFGPHDDRLGAVVVFDPVDTDLDREAATEAVFDALTEKVRRATMNIGGLLEIIALYSEEDRGGLTDPLRRIQGEVADLSTAVSEHDRAGLAMVHNAWPRSVEPLREVMQAVAPKTLGAGFTEAPGQTHVQCDLFLMTHLMEIVTRRVTDLANQDSALWTVAPASTAAPASARGAAATIQLALSWTGTPLSQEWLEHLMAQPLFAPYQRLTLAQALKALDCDIWLSGAHRLNVELPLGQQVEAPPPAKAHRRFFDFPDSRPQADKRLADLAFVVFDTETTGLDAATDDVVQIAGVRLLRSRLVEDDVFDRLVHPNRAIPAASTAIHGITDAMVADAPQFTKVATDFADYAGDAVLVAHHAAFDRAFLDRCSAQGGPTFPNPVLCTALLSQALNPQINDHTLDALADRYGVEIKPQHRHTALGDAYATAGVFQKMLPILSQMNVTTLDRAVALQSGG